MRNVGIVGGKAAVPIDEVDEVKNEHETTTLQQSTTEEELEKQQGSHKIQ